MTAPRQPFEASNTSQATNWPSISIVVPAFNAEDTLPDCIESLLAQDYPIEKREILIVDNESTDRSFEVLQVYKEQITTLKEPKRGSAAARNTGVSKASHEFIAFTDADCVADRTWLRQLATATFENSTADFIGGRIAAYNPSTLTELYGEKVLSQEDGLTRFHPPYAITANLLIRKKFIVELGMFDESFLRGQDAELSYRGYKRGAEFLYAENAVVFHHNVKNLRQLFYKGVQHGSAAAHFYRKNPERSSTSRLGRCIGGRFYWAIIKSLLRAIRYFIQSLYTPNRKLNLKAAFAFFDAVFNLGKQSGFVKSTLIDQIPLTGRS